MASDKVLQTLTMIDQMKRGASLDRLLESTRPAHSLPQLILPHLRNMSYETLGILIGTSRPNVYKIMGGKSHPEKDMILRIAITLEMSVEETQDMLRSAHRTPLTASDERDVCIMYALINLLDSEDTDALLREKGFPTLWPST